MNFIVEVENTSKNTVDRGCISFPPQSTRTVVVPDYNMAQIKAASALKVRIVSIEGNTQTVTPTAVKPPVEKEPPVVEETPVLEDEEPVAPVDDVTISEEPVEEKAEVKQVGKNKSRSRKA